MAVPVGESEPAIAIRVYVTLCHPVLTHDEIADLIALGRLEALPVVEHSDCKRREDALDVSAHGVDPGLVQGAGRTPAVRLVPRTAVVPGLVHDRVAEDGTIRNGRSHCRL